MQTHLEHAAKAGRQTPINGGSRGTASTAALNFESQQLDSATGQAVNQVFRRLRAELAFIGYALSKSNDGYVVMRRGVRWTLHNLHSVVCFLSSTGGRDEH